MWQQLAPLQKESIPSRNVTVAAHVCGAGGVNKETSPRGILVIGEKKKPRKIERSSLDEACVCVIP